LSLGFRGARDFRIGDYQIFDDQIVDPIAIALCAIFNLSRAGCNYGEKRKRDVFGHGLLQFALISARASHQYWFAPGRPERVLQVEMASPYLQISKGDVVEAVNQCATIPTLDNDRDRHYCQRCDHCRTPVLPRFAARNRKQ
jgi:hypothetical protein